LAKDEGEFIEKMQALIEDSKLRKGMGLNARLRVEENYSLKILGRQLFDIIQAI